MSSAFAISIAAFAALIATATFVLLLRSKKLRITVTHTYVNEPSGKRSVRIHVTNPVERPVTIQSAFLKSRVFRVQWSARLSQAWRRMRGSKVAQVHDVVATYPATSSPSGHRLPAELKPGESLSMEIDFGTVALQPVGSSNVGVADGLGKQHYSAGNIEMPVVKRPKLRLAENLSFYMTND